MFLISQILVGIAFFFDLLSFQFKNRTKILICFCVSSTLLACHFALLSHWTACVVGIVSVIRFVVSYFTASKRVMLLIMALSILVSWVTYSGVLTVLACVGTLIYTYAVFNSDDKSLRIFMMLGTAYWIVHNIIAQSPSAVALDSFFLISNMVGYYRYYFRQRVSEV